MTVQQNVLLAENQEVLKIKLGKILKGHVLTLVMECVNGNTEFVSLKQKILWLPKVGELLVFTRSLTLTCNLKALKDQKWQTRQQFDMGCQHFYDHGTLLKTVECDKNSTREVIDVNIPRRSMKFIVTLCQVKYATDSKRFVNFGVENVKVTIDSYSNSLFSQGPAKSDIDDAARRFFGTKHNVSYDYLTKPQFLKNKYSRVRLSLC